MLIDNLGIRDCGPWGMELSKDSKLNRGWLMTTNKWGLSRDESYMVDNLSLGSDLLIW